MSTLDFSAARLAHLSWKMKLRSFLDGKRELAENRLASHRDCELGKWLYSKGMERYGTILNMQHLEKVHVELHRITKQILEFKKTGNIALAEKEYARLEQISDKIISLLTSIEKEINE
jgi:methyl-accepting chemotaxis protein